MKQWWKPQDSSTQISDDACRIGHLLSPMWNIGDLATGLPAQILFFRYRRIIDCFGLEGTLRGHLAQPSCGEQGYLRLDQVAQSPVQPGLECFRGWMPLRAICASVWIIRIVSQDWEILLKQWSDFLTRARRKVPNQAQDRTTKSVVGFFQVFFGLVFHTRWSQKTLYSSVDLQQQLALEQERIKKQVYGDTSQHSVTAVCSAETLYLTLGS